MRKFFTLLVISVMIYSCSTTETTTLVTKDTMFSMKDELNKSIIDGFFDGDSTKIPENTYFIR